MTFEQAINVHEISLGNVQNSESKATGKVQP